MIDSTHNRIRITLPVHKLPPAITLTPDLPDDLLERLSTAPVLWANPLWHRIRPIHHLDTLLTAIQSGTPILMCSDASIDAAKQSCCAWTIHANEPLWRGKGIVPGHRDDIYSGQSEAFGILTALMFLGNYLSMYPTIIQSDLAPVTVYCDSASVITNITRTVNARSVFPNSTIEGAILHAIIQLQPLTINFRHVKGHQDSQLQRWRPLTIPEQLNIDCDKRAASLLPYARQSQQPDNPCLPTSYPHLITHGKTLVQEIPGSLCHAATTPDYRTYLQEKYQLSDTAAEDINWLTLKLTIRWFQLSDCMRLHKFLHDWLPLKGASHTATNNDSNLCPHCRREPETIWHFLECQHPSRTARFLQLQAAIMQLHAKHHVDPHLTQLYWQGLQAIRQDTSIDDQLDAYPPSYQMLFTAQRAIGWDQLYYGRISVQWARTITSNSNYQLNGDLFYMHATEIVWHYILDCWALRNQALHNPQDIPPEMQVLAAQVHHILDNARNNPELAHMVPAQPAETIIQRPIRQLRQWVQRGKTHVDNYLTAVHKRAVLHTHDIRKFFSPKQANDLRPP